MLHSICGVVRPRACADTDVPACAITSAQQCGLLCAWLVRVGRLLCHHLKSVAGRQRLPWWHLQQPWLQADLLTMVQRPLPLRSPCAAGQKALPHRHFAEHPCRGCPWRAWRLCRPQPRSCACRQTHEPCRAVSRACNCKVACSQSQCMNLKGQSQAVTDQVATPRAARRKLVSTSASRRINWCGAASLAQRRSLKMRTTASITTVAVLLALHGLASAFYDDGTDVKNLTPSNFDDTLSKQDGVFAIEFYAPWCFVSVHATRPCNLPGELVRRSMYCQRLPADLCSCFQRRCGHCKVRCNSS